MIYFRGQSLRFYDLLQGRRGKRKVWETLLLQFSQISGYNILGLCVLNPINIKMERPAQIFSWIPTKSYPPKGQRSSHRYAFTSGHLHWLDTEITTGKKKKSLLLPTCPIKRVRYTYVKRWSPTLSLLESSGAVMNHCSLKLLGSSDPSASVS